MGQRDFAAIAAVVVAMAVGLSGCFATRLVQTDTVVSYELIRAPEAPPPFPADAVVSAPSSGPVGTTWMEPYWMWSGSAYTWMVGRWVPTLAGYSFLQPRWRASHGGWAMTGGGWVDRDGHVIATPPPAASSTSGSQCAPTPPSSYVASTPVAAPSTPSTIDLREPPTAAHRRLDHTVTLGHRSYEPLRIDHGDAEPTDHVDGAWVTTRGATAPSPPVGRSSYTTAPPPSYGPPTYRGSVSSGTSYASSGSTYGSSSASSSASASSRTGYAPSTGGGSAPSFGGGGSWGGRTGYVGGGGRSSWSGGATRAP